MIRLQGQQFRTMKPLLTFLGYQMSDNGHIRAIMKLKTDDKTRIGGPTKKMYFHWLNPEEEAKFKQSDFYKNNQALLDFELYPRRKSEK